MMRLVCHKRAGGERTLALPIWREPTDVSP
jgi:hypothetical protein